MHDPMRTKIRELGHLQHYPHPLIKFVAEQQDIFPCQNPTNEHWLTLLNRSLAVSINDTEYHSLGKFQSALDERIYTASLDSADLEMGDAESLGHFVYMEFTASDLVELGILTTWITLCGGNNDASVPVGAIVCTTNSGAVDVDYFDTGADLDKAWEEVEKLYDEIPNDECDAILNAERGGYSIGIEGIQIGMFNHRVEAEYELYMEMLKLGIHYNAWFYDEAGDAHRILRDSKQVHEVINDYVQHVIEVERGTDA